MMLQLGMGQARTGFIAILGLTLIAMALSLYIVYQAFRGYRRNDSRSMLFLAIGLALLTIAPVLLWIVGASIGDSLGLGPRLYRFFIPISNRIIQIAGLCCILYSLLISPRRAA